jgi:ketosteroid isomerase-like protein
MECGGPGSDTERTMSEENVAAYREALDAYNRSDRAAFVARCDPVVENIPPSDWPESRPLRGPGPVWDFLRREGTEPWEDSYFAVSELIEAPDDALVAHVEAKLRGTASGATVQWSFWQVARFREGKLLRLEWFTDRAEALDVAGLSR